MFGVMKIWNSVVFYGHLDVKFVELFVLKWISIFLCSLLFVHIFGTFDWVHPVFFHPSFFFFSFFYFLLTLTARLVIFSSLLLSSLFSLSACVFARLSYHFPTLHHNLSGPEFASWIPSVLPYIQLMSYLPVSVFFSNRCLLFSLVDFLSPFSPLHLYSHDTDTPLLLIFDPPVLLDFSFYSPLFNMLSIFFCLT